MKKAIIDVGITALAIICLCLAARLAADAVVFELEYRAAQVQEVLR